MSDPYYSVKLRDDVAVGRTEKGRIALVRNGISRLRIPEHRVMEGLIGHWMTEGAIDRLIESEANPSSLYYLVERLFSLGLLCGQYAVEGRRLFSLTPAPDWNRWRENPPRSAGRLSPYAYLRRAGCSFVLETPLSPVKCLIEDERCLGWLMEITGGGKKRPVGEGAFEAFCRALWLTGALEGDNSVSDVWEFHDLLFFHHSSMGFHDDSVGATWRLKDRHLPEPAFKPSVFQLVPLPEPDGRLIEKAGTPFCEVLARRRTSRAPGKEPLTMRDLGALLHLAARVQSVREDVGGPCPVSLRPSPSGGGLHSIEIYVLVRECAGLGPGAWRYDPARHGLEAVVTDGGLVDTYVNENPHPHVEGAGPPHIRLVMTSRFLRDAWKYEKIAYRLVLQDLGCLYQTLSLAATALGLGSCILGVVDARRLGRMLRLETIREPVIGEMLVSSQ